MEIRNLLVRLNIIYLYNFKFLKIVLKKIAIIGPESTGKSSLAIWLTEKLNGIRVPEVSRKYLIEKGSDYSVEDIYAIAKLQKETENKDSLKSKSNYLICDTELICILVWLDFYSYPIERWLIETIEKDNYELYLLMNIDIKWEKDELRNNPYDRVVIFKRFIYFLEKFNKNYKIISGTGIERYQNALNEINHL